MSNLLADICFLTELKFLQKNGVEIFLRFFS
jgi:hypothetical protein